MGERFRLGDRVTVSHIYKKPANNSEAAHGLEDGDQLEMQLVPNRKAADIAVVIGTTRRCFAATLREGDGDDPFASGGYRYLDWNGPKRAFYAVRYTMNGPTYLTDANFLTKVEEGEAPRTGTATVLPDDCACESCGAKPQFHKDGGSYFCDECWEASGGEAGGGI